MTPALMRVGERRDLTLGEIAIARSMFGEDLDYGRIRLFQAPPLGFGAMVPLGRTIVFSRWRAVRDFAFLGIEEQGWLLHELTHCWQSARGRILAYAKLSAIGLEAYRFSPGGAFGDYNIEQQAEIVRHLYLAREGVLGDADRDALETLWASRQGR